MTTQAANPFLHEFNKPHGTPPFSAIENSHYEEAIDRGINLAQQEIDAIVNNRAVPDFDNTIVAMERSGADLDRVLGVFYPLLEANADDEMMDIAMRTSQKLSDLSLIHI